MDLSVWLANLPEPEGKDKDYGFLVKHWNYQLAPHTIGAGYATQANQSCCNNELPSCQIAVVLVRRH